MSEEKQVTDQYLELYKLAVEMADRTAARRQNMFTFPFTANTALLAIFFSGEFFAPLWALAWAGLLVSVAWWGALRSYRMQSAAKYRVILEMEKNLEAQIYHEEQKALREYQTEGWHSRYATATLAMTERVVPLAMAAIYLALLFLPLL